MTAGTYKYQMRLYFYHLHAHALNTHRLTQHVILLQAGDDSAEMHQRLKDLGVPIPTGPDAVPSLPSAPVPLGNIIPAPTMGMGVGQPYPLLPQIPVGPTEFLSVNGMVTAQVLADDVEYKEVGFARFHRSL